MIRLCRRAVYAVLVACAPLTLAPTSWFVDPHRLYVTSDEHGLALLHFERTVPFPIYVWRQRVMVDDRTGERACEQAGYVWMHPDEDGFARATPFRPGCASEPESGSWRFHVTFRACLWRLCARSTSFVSDPMSVDETLRFRSISEPSESWL